MMRLAQFTIMLMVQHDGTVNHSGTGRACADTLDLHCTSTASKATFTNTSSRLRITVHGADAPASCRKSPARLPKPV